MERDTPFPLQSLEARWKNWRSVFECHQPTTICEYGARALTLYVLLSLLIKWRYFYLLHNIFAIINKKSHISSIFVLYT